MEHSPFNLDFQNSSIESKIIASLERISQAFRVMLWNEGKEHALSPVQIQVLLFVRFQSRNKCRVSYLAEEFNMTKATMSEVVKSLEQKGLIFKIDDPVDHRSYTLSLTEKGTALAEKTSMFAKDLFKPIDLLRPEDKENLLLNLINIIHSLNQSGVITIQRMCFTCVYYKQKDSGQTHFCDLLNTKLQPEELRIDCPEHELKQ